MSPSTAPFAPQVGVCGTDKYRHQQAQRMAAIDSHDDRSDQLDNNAVAAHRDRAVAKIDQIAQQTKQALIDAGIDLGIFFLRLDQSASPSSNAPLTT